jgi:methionyl-tRNA formyltransferase
VSDGATPVPQVEELPLAPIPRHARRLVFLGTPEMAVPPLRALVAAGFDVAGVVTRVDKRRGRGGELSPSPVKGAALDLGLDVVHRVDEILDRDAELGVVVAFGQIIRPHVLAALPMVNLHFSLLPRWRGAAPVERALLAGDTETGVCVMQVEHGLDTGGVFARSVVPIGARTTAVELRAALVDVGTRLLVSTLEHALGQPEPQVGEVTYAAKIDPAELRVDWRAPVLQIDRLVRVGGAWTTFRGRRLKIVDAEPAAESIAPGAGASGGAVVPADAPGTISDGTVACGEGRLVLRIVQPEGKSMMPAAAWANGARPAPGERFD